jgi:prepilin signal peptidase PulO-like enzyme (type II secretory pathway)
MNFKFCPTCKQPDSGFEKIPIYKAVWSRLGGKPFTYRFREHPIKTLVAFLISFVLLFWFVGKDEWKGLTLGILLSALCAHIFW